MADFGRRHYLASIRTANALRDVVDRLIRKERYLVAAIDEALQAEVFEERQAFPDPE